MIERPARILVTGSRHWTDIPKVSRVLGMFVPDVGWTPELVHGDCEGLDRIAANIWASFDGPTFAVPAAWSKHGRAAGPIRNQQMVDLPGIEVCLAFPLGRSVGTRDCMDKARQAGITVLEVS